jgi:4-hydroxybenzoate polyprenyltransferase
LDRLSSTLPLVVDLDGTLTPTDTLVESIVVLLRRGPVFWWRLLMWVLNGRAEFKRRISDHAVLQASDLPWRAEFVDWLKAERDRGRRLILATAADHRIAEAVAKHLGIFESVLATRDGVNLKGLNKLDAIRAHLGNSDFVYAGDHAADLPIWAAARAAVLVGAAPDVARRARSTVAVEREFAAAPAGLSAWVKAARLYQWVKNLLLFVPAFTAFGVAASADAGRLLVAFLAFSLVASGSYLFNDIWDLESDRAHARKCKRPFASGALSPLAGFVVALGLIVVGHALAAAVSWQFAAMVFGYLVLTTAYSWVLKSYVLLDILTLALLYTYRVQAGAVVIEVELSTWLLAFSVFLFTSLALVKRCAELVGARDAGRERARGRDYAVGDLAVLWPLGVGSSLSAVLVFGLYLGSPQAQALYGSSAALWLVGVGLIYWLGRIWIKTVRGEMHDDPIVFALRDRASRWCMVCMFAWVATIRVFH